MLKKNKKDIIITSIITLLPIFIGIILWDKLPNKIPTHFNASGVADGWSNKTFGIFGIPFILLATHIICVFVTALDPKADKNEAKIIKMIYWFMPCISIITNGMIYMQAMKINVGITFITHIMLGVTFILLGIYLPKVKNNYTIGIKVPWTLEDDEVWDKTHKLAGKIWLIAGIIFTVNALVNSTIILIILVVVMVFVPVVYSYFIYKNKHDNCK